MSKRFTLALLGLMAVLTLHAQEIDLDKEFFHLPDSVTDGYLDSLSITSRARINDYWIVGVHGGVSVQHGDFNPIRYLNWYPHMPLYGFSITRYATMMNTFPIMGMELGFQQNYEGYNFKEFVKDGITYRQHVSNAYEAVMEVPEVFVLTHAHLDMGQYAKVIVKAGMYGGYRRNITRAGEYVDENIVHVFLDTDRRWSYGVQGGLGFGLMLDPFEFHLMAQVKWGWSSFYQPDYLSPYYYRYGYPLDGAVTFGIYYQLTPRRGHTKARLRRMARQMVEQEMNGNHGNENSQGR